MPRPEGIKSLPIPREIHKEVKRESVDLDVSMGEVLRLMWDAYANRDSQQLPAISPQTIQESDMISVAGLSKGHRRYLETIADGLRNKDVGVIGAAETAARMWEQAQALITKESDAQEETAEKGRRVAGTRG